MADPVHILITGGAGQVGLALQRVAWPDGVVLHAPDRAALDITDLDAIASAFAQTRFAAVINAAAYTAVDRAESDREAAFAVNATAPEFLAVGEEAQGEGLQRLGDIGGGGGAADLILDHAQGGPVGGEAQHGLQEVGAVWAEHPGGAQDDRPAGPLQDGAFAGQFGCAVDAERADGVLLDIGGGLRAVEDIVGRHVKEWNPCVLRAGVSGRRRGGRRD
ncbi:MAG: NAD-dependent epimerase/dehydratase family protein, partial [Brevundimonas sp.]